MSGTKLFTVAVAATSAAAAMLPVPGSAGVPASSAASDTAALAVELAAGSVPNDFATPSSLAAVWDLSDPGAGAEAQSSSFALGVVDPETGALPAPLDVDVLFDAGLADSAAEVPGSALGIVSLILLPIRIAWRVLRWLWRLAPSVAESSFQPPLGSMTSPDDLEADPADSMAVHDLDPIELQAPGVATMDPVLTDLDLGSALSDIFDMAPSDVAADLVELVGVEDTVTATVISTATATDAVSDPLFLLP